MNTPVIFRNFTYFSEEPGALHKKWLRSKGLMCHNLSLRKKNFIQIFFSLQNLSNCICELCIDYSLSKYLGTFHDLHKIVREDARCSRACEDLFRVLSFLTRRSWQHTQTENCHHHNKRQLVAQTNIRSLITIFQSIIPPRQTVVYWCH